MAVTITISQAKAKLPEIIAKAEAGEEVLIADDQNHPTVKLVPITPKAGRLTRHPELVGSTKTLDPAALVKPLPPEAWGDLGNR